MVGDAVTMEMEKMEKKMEKKWDKFVFGCYSLHAAIIKKVFLA